ncbi:MAG: LemA family protein [Chromatiales bacterium 21-64-14]|nr:MAG: LemA family protein [Chromatiales bacterium 21-64-14]HQU15865.1 LemA family protein [Gammaproteobacteria bacterium]
MDTSTVIGATLGLGTITVAVYAVVLYNRLVSLKHCVSKAWSNIDVLLTQRHDELPKLVAVCKQYMGYEQETLERVMDARARVANAREQHDVRALGPAEAQLRSGLGSLYAVVENYPDLKANTTFVHLQDRITSLESTIADRREYYNESVNLNNIRIEQFPDVIIARRYGFEPFHLLEFSAQERADVDMGALFAT